MISLDQLKAGLKGVSARADGRFEARISINGRQRSIGYCATPEAAHAVYVAFAENHFGKYARFT